MQGRLKSVRQRDLEQHRVAEVGVGWFQEAASLPVWSSVNSGCSSKTVSPISMCS